METALDGSENNLKLNEDETDETSPPIAAPKPPFPNTEPVLFNPNLVQPLVDLVSELPAEKDAFHSDQDDQLKPIIKDEQLRQFDKNTDWKKLVELRRQEKNMQKLSQRESLPSISSKSPHLTETSAVQKGNLLRIWHRLGSSRQRDLAYFLGGGNKVKMRVSTLKSILARMDGEFDNGQGGSHASISLPNTRGGKTFGLIECSETDSESDTDDEDETGSLQSKNVPDHAKGPGLNPHGSAHAQKIMQNFRLDLFRKSFVRAGITQETLLAAGIDVREYF